MKITSLVLSSLSVLPLASALPATRRQASCTAANAIQRKEYSDLTTDEKLAFISAVKCVQSLPSRFAPGEIPASENLFDDFTAVHIDLSLSIHLSGTFLSWHREYLRLLETVMHEQCGYPAGLGIPYWQWTKYSAATLELSPIFDGSETSLGSNGSPDPNGKPYELTPGVFVPHGTGGLCVERGPFANTTVRFGPYPNSAILTGLPANWTQPNPRCLTRDINPTIIGGFLNAARIAQLQASENIAVFQERLTPNTATASGGLGAHRSGHIAIGMPMMDFFASPQDIVFFLHHAEVDRQWSMWQDADESRRFSYNGTSTVLNPVGVTPEVSNSTVITFGVLGDDMTLEEVAYINQGRYCYQYV
ncbi:uncharacterized protein B0I36DRAFT_69380 [Microdochium trichocladiopsis]|uniref:Tyrosinase copper-binding domain-containing protein n=1 Tax=Microdochium trichocladiopsis TaxID=1682393 RepID=A0A9P8YGS0_9PEZI|nr:uncharacterized protein B0I36DRAFT_69380 [Microdochium trichocladiopsis]KAH7037658.1 hypothetical protein B0I36DRAFT_69380 [Microdochium trichocladiopsis]